MLNVDKILFFAGLFGLSGIALGALGAHALAETLGERDTVAAWDAAVRYHFLHAAALFALAIWNRSGAAPPFASVVAWCWGGGIVIFSGTLYILALGGPGFLGPVTPIGGVLFMAGWAMICGIACLFRPHSRF